MRHLHPLRRGLFLSLGIASVLLPLLWTALASLKVQVNNTVTPPVWSLPVSFASYTEIQSEQTFFWQEFATSLALSGLTMLLTVTVSLLAAYCLARTGSPWRRLAVQASLILATIPAISFVFPLGDVLHYLRLHDTFTGVALAETAMLSPLAVYILHGFIGQIPRELEEAAVLDGATLPQVLTGIVLPTISSGMIATAVIVFVLSWNQFFLPVVLTATRIRVIPVMMRDFFALEREFDWTVASAVLVVALLPASVFVAAAHRALERFRFAAVTEVE